MYIHVKLYLVLCRVNKFVLYHPDKTSNVLFLLLLSVFQLCTTTDVNV